jgi:hypothetical protein
LVVSYAHLGLAAPGFFLPIIPHWNFSDGVSVLGG